MKKNYITLLAVLIIFGIVVFILVGIPELKKREALKKSTNIVIGYDTFWSYDSENKWRNMDKKIVYGSKKFSVYIDKKFKGNFDIDLINDKWYYFNSENNEESYQGELFAHNGSRNIKLVDYNSSLITVDDLKYLNDIFDNIDISAIILNDLLIGQKVTIDIDNDSKNECIYSISNFYCEQCNKNKYFSTVFIVDNNNVTILDKSYNENDYYEIPLYSLEYIIDIDENKNYELILSRTTAGNNKTYHELFIKNKEIYKKVVSSGG